MTNPINAVQNFNAMVISGSQSQTIRTVVVTIMNHISDLRREANSDVIDGPSRRIPCHPFLDGWISGRPTPASRAGDRPCLVPK